MLKKYQLPELPYETIRPYVSMGSRGLIQLGFNISEPHDSFSQRKQEYLNTYLQHLMSIPLFFQAFSRFLSICMSKSNLGYCDQ